MDEDKTAIIRLIVGAFNEWVEEYFDGDHPEDDKIIEYGRQLLEMPEKGPLTAMWLAFYGGFGQGIVFRGEMDKITAEEYDEIKKGAGA